jgi:hypothetical protein
MVIFGLNKKQITLFLLSVILIFILFYFELIHKTYIPYFENTVYETYSDLKYFGDTQSILISAECHKSGINVFIPNDCMGHYGISDSAFQYGRILLAIPNISEINKELILIIYGSILIFIFIFVVVKLINPTSIFDNIVCIALIFNPTTLLLIERLNFDLLIFLLLILMVIINKNYFIKVLLNLFLFSIKYYPILFVINFFIEDKLSIKKKLFFISLFFTMTIILIFFTINDFKYIFENAAMNGRNIKYAFSVNALSRVLDHIFLANKDIIKLMITIGLIVISSINYAIFNKKILSYEENDINKKLFIICGNLLIILYIAFNNNYFREVFFIGLIPYILTLSKKNCIYSKMFLYFILFKYFFMIIFWPKVMFSNVHIESLIQYLVSIKIVIDYIVISFLITFIINLNISVIKETFKGKRLIL